MTNEDQTNGREDLESSEVLEEFPYEYSILNKDAIERRYRGGDGSIYFLKPSFTSFLTSLAYAKLRRRKSNDFSAADPLIYAGFSGCCNDSVLILNTNGKRLEPSKVASPRMNICAILPTIREGRASSDCVEKALSGDARYTDILVTGGGCSNRDRELAIIDFGENDIKYVEGVPKSSGRAVQEGNSKITNYPVYGFELDYNDSRIFTRYRDGSSGIDITSRLSDAGVHILKTLELNEYFKRMDSH